MANKDFFTEHAQKCGAK